MVKKHKKVSILFSVFFSFGLVVPFGVSAAILYLEPSQGEYHLSDTFLVEARIDTEEECINTVKADLSFSKDILEGIDFSQGNSILTIWLQTPKIDQSAGLLSFVGGIPGGYCGTLPGEPGKPNLLGRVIFQAKEKGANGGLSSAEVKFLESSQVLLNDGLGTPAKLSLRGANFTILPEKKEMPMEEWQEELKKDNIPPEPFEIEIHQDPAIFEGKYFIVFSTTDKQTGLDYYEVHEVPPKWTLRTTKPERAESPYLLKDQSLKSIIKVRVVDKAGNERIAEYTPPYKITWKDWLPWIILVLIVGGIIWYLITKLKRNYTRNRI